MRVLRVQPPGVGEGEGLPLPVLLAEGEAKAPALGVGVALGAPPVHAKPLMTPLELSVTNTTPEALSATKAG
jgi:hypothetical protein